MRAKVELASRHSKTHYFTVIEGTKKVYSGDIWEQIGLSYLGGRGFNVCASRYDLLQGQPVSCGYM